ncbi:hypothetical protein [Dyadobacter sp.]|uniref:hypothetical protein n=1 Tax=Dyadobacter sp. TaxID=1914288 RepID=UPI003F704C0A
MKYSYTLLLILIALTTYAQKQRYSKSELKAIVIAQQEKISNMEIEIASLSGLQKKYLKADQDKFACLNKLSSMLDSLKMKNDYIKSKNEQNQYLLNYINQLKEELRQKDRVVSSIAQPVISSPRMNKARYSLSNDDNTPTYKPSRRVYITGPRGGCYYINGNGNKTYVDRSLCR